VVRTFTYTDNWQPETDSLETWTAHWLYQSVIGLVVLLYQSLRISPIFGVNCTALLRLLALQKHHKEKRTSLKERQRGLTEESILCFISISDRARIDSDLHDRLGQSHGNPSVNSCCGQSGQLAAVRMAFTATPRHNSGSMPNPSFRKWPQIYWTYCFVLFFFCRWMSTLDGFPRLDPSPPLRPLPF
jgi:hypothetical protein